MLRFVAMLDWARRLETAFCNVISSLFLLEGCCVTLHVVSFRLKDTVIYHVVSSVLIALTSVLWIMPIMI